MMSDKRFIVDGLNIQDNSIKGRLYLLEDQGGVNALCNLINGLNNKKNRLEKENEQLRKQIQNYEQLISNSYVGEEETLDGFVGKYVIWENELQKYKNEMINNG